jgi:hypothetical protein
VGCTIRDLSEGIALLIAKLLLADAASVADGKLNMLGGGWTITGPQPIPSALVLLVDSVEPRESKTHESEIMLLHADGSPAVLGTSRGRPDFLRFQLSITEAVEAQGALVSLLLHAITIPPLPLIPGTDYAWRLTIDNEQRPEWTRPFAVRPEAPAQ